MRIWVPGLDLALGRPEREPLLPASSQVFVFITAVRYFPIGLAPAEINLSQMTPANLCLNDVRHGKQCEPEVVLSCDRASPGARFDQIQVGFSQNWNGFGRKWARADQSKLGFDQFWAVLG